MDLTWITGIVGALLLVTGAALPERAEEPLASPKDWCFAIGGFVMLLYAIFNYMAGGPIFFLFLELFVNVASVFMMFNVRDSIDTPIMIGVGIIFILWSLLLFQGIGTLFFVAGLTGIAMGYVMQTGTFRRSVALTVGSALIALFSYLSGSWIFFWLNVFFALFSLYYVWQLRRTIMAYAPLAQHHRRTRRRTRH